MCDDYRAVGPRVLQSSEPCLDHKLYFGSVANSMVTLFAMTIGAEWSEVVRPLWPDFPASVIFMMLFTMMTSCAILNLIIGSIVDESNRASTEEEQEMFVRKRLEKLFTVSSFRKHIFQQAAGDDGVLSRKEFETFSKMPHVETGATCSLQDMLSDLGLPSGFTLGDVHQMLDRDGDNQLSAKEFEEGLIRLINSDDFQRTCMLQLDLSQCQANMVEIKSMHSDIHTGVHQCQAMLVELRALHAELHCMHRDIHRDICNLGRMTVSPIARAPDDVDIPAWRSQEVPPSFQVDQVTIVNEPSARLDVDLLQLKLREEVDKLQDSLAAHIHQLRDVPFKTHQRPNAESSSRELSSLPTQSFNIKIQGPSERSLDGRQKLQQIPQSDRDNHTNAGDDGLTRPRSEWAILKKDYIMRLS
eukprot:gnl/TRDRNA2_/TRDRNA2_171472_c3_seq3.p1 gnl/TRDRNA2_/TRDRNA2_171472_c3~~gnl/TRDRNA2_/TRDRNA2_171472_c3_seq3.p1  ORF type:complete len:415 (-),score=25.31 gnl/TRDRNA2_/TRDRNA2_171472_c3_seq3:80-1324(-)